MPHCIIDYSNTLDSQTSADELMRAAYRAVNNAGLFNSSHIRVRARAYEHFQFGGDYRDFIHITLRLHQGRELAQKQQLTQGILSELQTLGLQSVSITVELVEMDSASYARHIEP